MYHMKKDISIIICYFGMFPKWMPFFINSCLHNQSISFVLFTDQMASEQINNIKIVGFTLRDFCALASNKLHLALSFNTSYKICDFRPAFGRIFEDYLSESKYWGYCDIDILFGNIRKFVGPLVEENFDIISSRREYLSGSFSLFKNSDKVNTLFQKSTDYQSVFLSEDNRVFDECGRIWWDLIAGRHINECRSTVDSMTHVISRMPDGYIKTSFETRLIEQDQFDVNRSVRPFLDKLAWNGGSLYSVRSQTEYMFFHFHFLKYSRDFLIPSVEEIPEIIYVDKDGFTFNL